MSWASDSAPNNFKKKKTMKTISTKKEPLWQFKDGLLLLHFNEKEDCGVFTYNTATVSEEPTKGEIVSAVIASEYDSISEIALLNNFNDGRNDHVREYEQYQIFRQYAKEIAAQILEEI